MKKQAFLTTCIFLCMLSFFSISFVWIPDKSFSEQENRTLRTFPHFSWESLANGDYSQAINHYFADQFPMRDLFVGIKGGAEIAMGKGENNGILLGTDGTLARNKFEILYKDHQKSSKIDGMDPSAIQTACNGINRAGSNLKLPFSVLLTGRNLDVTPEKFAYPIGISNSFLEAVQAGISRNVDRIDTISLFREKSAEGAHLYYKTDHHWTTPGAYLAYCEAMRAFGMENELLPESAFAKNTVSDSFYGSLWSASGMKWIQPDTVELWTYGNEDHFEVIADGKKLSGFYSEKRLMEKDHYSVFLDGVHDIVTVQKTDDANRPKLLIVKDSFANSLAPFLAQHFDLVLLNLSSTRNDFTNISALSEHFGADRVLLVYTLENLLCADKLARLQ